MADISVTIDVAGTTAADVHDKVADALNYDNAKNDGETKAQFYNRVVCEHVKDLYRQGLEIASNSANETALAALTFS
ncbi:hypothetical protein [Pararhizobium sp.]|uniref:hypothetical protein n=1 Tax=Pararhizobium sp. TaxID=1977563 RepID=UPI003D0AA30F